MNNGFTVVGAGMAGLLAAAMLRDECRQVLEQQPALPNNHSALLRFRSSIVGDTLNIPFQKVRVMKTVVGHTGNPIGDALSYSLKTNGSLTLRSSVSANGEIEERFIAPANLIEQMARKVTAPIHYGWSFGNRLSIDGPVISTIPMPTLMRLLGYNEMPEFRSVPGYTMNALLRDSDVCATIYITDPARPAYRASITGNRLTVEYAAPGTAPEEMEHKMRWLAGYSQAQMQELEWILSMFGLRTDHLQKVKPEVKEQKYAKILPIEDGVRKRFIMWASEKHNVYSLGRFATWRPGLLMDDLVNDIRVILRVSRHGSYEHKKAG